MNLKAEPLHWLQGTRPTRGQNTGAEIAPGRPAYPRGLTAPERREFKAACAMLEKRRQLTPGDAPLLEMYAVIRARWQRARLAILENGEYETLTRLDSHGVAHETRRHSLEYKTAVECEKNLTALADRLGLTPMNRAKVKQAGVQPAPVPGHAETLDEAMARKYVQPADPFAPPQRIN